MDLGDSKNSSFSMPLVHEYGCDALDMPPDDLDPLADISTTRDDLIAYAIQLRPHYERVNRVIAQLAGLFILAQARGRFEADHDAVVKCIEQATACVDAIAGIRPPPMAKRQYWCTSRAVALVNGVTAEFGASTRDPARVREYVARWTDQLRRANALIRWASERSLGLSPIDLSQACCNCGSAAHATTAIKA
ncbi:hypothetical protein [Pararobbsia alpina]|uniref:Uncharacterized protein n=1 Tax=Pararobbsia alpina TaxID=621374 RepID=A0A6S7C3H5_9BURK|nr:hypothetical protein [Pararobbsia alpina]CAB3780197.1 hypothetical protein LMG28138_00988 [Pararobbsia alpina]